MKIDIAQELHDLAVADNTDGPTREAAEQLADEHRHRDACIVKADKYHPDSVAPIDDEWADLFRDVHEDGSRWAQDAKIVVCGMARNIGGILPATFHRIGKIVEQFRDYGIVIVENDSTDNTKQLLADFASDNRPRVTVSSTDYGWEHLHGFEATRVERYAKFRNEFREIARDKHPDADAVLVVDMDLWGGWSVPGLLNGCGWLQRYKDAACMASTSLFQHRFFAEGSAWGHYDTWALRVHGWTHKLAAWKTLWVPPPGSPPVKVFSAFGGAALYRPEAFYKHAYASIDGDIEHAGLHTSMVADGWNIYLNPAQRSLMLWLTDEGDDERRHDGD